MLARETIAFVSDVQQAGQEKTAAGADLTNRHADCTQIRNLAQCTRTPQDPQAQDDGATGLVPALLLE